MMLSLGKCMNELAWQVDLSRTYPCSVILLGDFAAPDRGGTRKSPASFSPFPCKETVSVALRHDQKLFWKSEDCWTVLPIGCSLCRRRLHNGTLWRLQL